MEKKTIKHGGKEYEVLYEVKDGKKIEYLFDFYYKIEWESDTTATVFVKKDDPLYGKIWYEKGKTTINPIPPYYSNGRLVQIMPTALDAIDSVNRFICDDYRKMYQKMYLQTHIVNH